MIISFIIALFLFTGIVFLKMYLENKELRERFEDVHIISNHPDDGREISLPALQRVIVTAKYNNVIKEVANTKKSLRKAKNPLFEKGKLSVYYYIFQSGENINESWEEFTERCELEIKELRIKKHVDLKRADSDWYAKFADHQTGVKWKKHA